MDQVQITVERLLYLLGERDVKIDVLQRALAEAQGQIARLSEQVRKDHGEPE